MYYILDLVVHVGTVHVLGPTKRGVSKPTIYHCPQCPCVHPSNNDTHCWAPGWDTYSNNLGCSRQRTYIIMISV